MDVETLNEQAETIELIRYVLEENAKHLHPQQAASLRRDVESFIPAIISHWDNDELVNDFITAINWQYTKWLWVDVTAHPSK